MPEYHMGTPLPSEDEPDGANTASDTNTNSDSNTNAASATTSNATNEATNSYSNSQSLWLSAKNAEGKQRHLLLENEHIMLRNWMQKIRIYQKASYLANSHYKHWDTILGLTPIILNAAVLLMEGYEFVYTSERVVTVIAFAMIAIATIVKAIHSFLKLSKQSESMRQVSDKLAQVYLQIQIYLAQSEDPIIPPVKFIEIVYKDMTKLMEESANIPISIMSKYQSRLQELDSATIKMEARTRDD